MKAILFPYYFEAPDELNEFCKSIGYDNPDYSNDYNLMFDSRVVEFCEQRLSGLWNEKVYKGRDSYKFRIGFAGAGYIRDIDTTRKWRIKYSNVDAPIIDYVDIVVNDYGLVSFVSVNKEQEHKKEQKVIQKKMVTTKRYENYTERIKEHNKEQDKKRLEYAIQQLELNNIEYHILNEENTFIECRKLNTNMWIKYFASSGYIMGFRDFRGIKTLIELLTTEV